MALNLYQFFILPFWLLPGNRVWAWTLLPAALLTNPFWSLIHEAIHDLFHPRRPVNVVFRPCSRYGCSARRFAFYG